MTLRLVLWIDSSLFVSSSVSEEWKTTLQYSAILRMKRTYIVIRSSIAIPAYLSLHKIYILVYTFMQISFVFLFHFISSWSHTPSTRMTLTLSSNSLFKKSLVLNSSLEREKMMYLLFNSFSFMRFSSVQSLISFRYTCVWSWSVGRNLWSVAMSDATCSLKEYSTNLSDKKRSSKIWMSL